MPSGKPPDDRSDEELIGAVASGSEEAIAGLYRRYGPTILGMATHALDRGAAEEIVQDVFLSVWKNARSFDQSRGPLRPWLLQIAHYRIANALRRGGRRREAPADADGVAALPDQSPDPLAQIWAEYRRSVVRRAFEELPPPQRQALGLAFFEELSHGEVASILDLPLGTAKSRIRAGLQTLRGRLAPLIASLILCVLLAGLVTQFQAKRRALARDERALAMLTASDSVTLRLEAAPGVSERTHGTYRSRPGSPIGVLTLSNFPAAPPGRTYQAWLLRGGKWLSLGTARPDSAGKARLVAEDPALAARPDAIEVTLEPERGSSSPGGPKIIGWSAR